MQLKIKKLVDHAEIPKYAHDTDAGMDLVATSKEYYVDDKFIEYGTGLAIEVPRGCVGLLFPRSSISKTPMSLANSVGVLDRGYQGEVKLRFRTDLADDREHLQYCVGDRVAQLVVVPFFKVDPLEVEDFETSERGTGGFGSTGK